MVGVVVAQPTLRIDRQRVILGVSVRATRLENNLPLLSGRNGDEAMDVWDEFLLLVYGLPLAIVVGTALSAKLAARRMDKPLGWGKAFAIGVATFMISFAGMLVYWLLKR